MIFHPLYWLVIGVSIALSAWAAFKVKGTFARFSRFTTRSGLSGAEVARRILSQNGIQDVRVEPVAGKLSDHYDPTSKTLRLSEPVYAGRSMAAFGVAAHEVGHAIQHTHGYAPLRFRSSWVPVANLGGGLSMIVVILAAVLGGAATVLGGTMALIGIGLMATTMVFTLVTLPVEYDASRRALLALEHGGYMTSEELDGARKVLNAAALTYVMAFVSSLLLLLYWAYALGLLGGGSSD
ncbi:MAG: zinc metallopeptidase [Planctomycetes bacterium]|nr:zinc metallopeptidase [Planctomycetota bacterium]